MQVEAIALWLKETAEYFGEEFWHFEMDGDGDFFFAIGAWNLLVGSGQTVEDAAWELFKYAQKNKAFP